MMRLRTVAVDLGLTFCFKNMTFFPPRLFSSLFYLLNVGSVLSVELKFRSEMDFSFVFLLLFILPG